MKTVKVAIVDGSFVVLTVQQDSRFEVVDGGLYVYSGDLLDFCASAGKWLYVSVDSVDVTVDKASGKDFSACSAVNTQAPFVFRLGHRVLILEGADAGRHGTIEYIGGDTGTYYGVKVDGNDRPAGYVACELCPAPAGV